MSQTTMTSDDAEFGGLEHLTANEMMETHPRNGAERDALMKA